MGKAHPLAKKLSFFNAGETRNCFFVIHQGILEKIEKENEGAAKTFMKNVKCRWKVVDSGRGIPAKLVEPMRFIEISALLKVLENFDKHGLVQMLCSSRHQSSTVGGNS